MPQRDQAGTPPRGLLRMIGEIAAQTGSLVVPRECPCGADGSWLCDRCAALLSGPVIRVDPCCDALQQLHRARVHELGPGLPAGVDHTALLPVLALGEYAGALQRLILAWKNGGMLHLAGRLGPALAPAVDRLATAAGVRRPPLVPVPSRLPARLRRGEDHVAELVRAIARTGVGHPLLLRSAPTTGQGGRGARQRRERRIRLRPGTVRQADQIGDRPVVIVDDVVTTGSTLRGMQQALTAAGIPVLGAVVIASARIPSPPAVP